MLVLVDLYRDGAGSEVFMSWEGVVKMHFSGENPLGLSGRLFSDSLSPNAHVSWLNF